MTFRIFIKTMIYSWWFTKERKFILDTSEKQLFIRNRTVQVEINLSSLCVMLCNLGVQFYFSLTRFNSTSYGLISLYKFVWNVISAKIQESNYIEQFNTKIQNCEAKIVPFQALTILHLQNWHQWKTGYQWVYCTFLGTIFSRFFPVIDPQVSLLQMLVI